MALANVALTDTFDTWRTRTNQLVVISNQITEGSLTTNGTIISTNTSAAGAINVTAGVIRVQGNNFTSNQITATSNTYLLTVSSTNSGRLGSTIFFNIVGSNSISDVSTANVATANAVNALNQNVVAGLLAGNNYTNQVGAASNAYANTLSTSDRTIANAAAVSANAYTVTIGAASNTWANTLSTSDRAVANAAANSANAYTITIGVAGNNYTNQVGAASNTYANTLYVSSLQNANNDANSANAFAITIGAAANNWSNTKLANTDVTIAGNLTSTGVFTDSTATLRPLVPMSTVALSTQSTVDFMGIPSWVKRITIIFYGVSLSGTDVPLIQIGSGSPGIITGGYQSYNSDAGRTSTSGFIGPGASSGDSRYGIFHLVQLDTGYWVCTGICNSSTTNEQRTVGYVYSGTDLTSIRLTRTGTNTFDAGSVKVIYE